MCSCPRKLHSGSSATDFHCRSWPSNWRGPDAGVPRSRQTPTIYLALYPKPCGFSLSKPVPLTRSQTNLPSRAPPCWRRGQPQKPHDGPRASPRGAGPTSLDTLLAPVSLLSPQAVGRPGPACWQSGDIGNFVERCPVMEVAGPGSGRPTECPRSSQVVPNTCEY